MVFLELVGESLPPVCLCVCACVHARALVCVSLHVFVCLFVCVAFVFTCIHNPNNCSTQVNTNILPAKFSYVLHIIGL